MRRLAPLAVLVAAALFLTGCGSDDSTPNASTSSTAPEDITTDAATVATGLGKIKDLAANIDASIDDRSKASGLDAQIEPIWSTIEGTVKANDPDTYLALEDAYAVLKNAVTDADATKSAAGARSVTDAVTTYLAKYPAS